MTIPVTCQAAAAPSPWAPTIKRDAVLQTAAQLFNERGFHATSLDDIAERLNVSKPTLYCCIGGKDQILLACVRSALDLIHAGIDGSARCRRQRGRAARSMHAAIVMQDFGRCVIRIGEDPLPAPLKKELCCANAGIDWQFRHLIEAGIAKGSLASCDPKMAGFMLAGALSWIGRWYREDGDLTPEQIAQQGIELLLSGALRRAPVPKTVIRRKAGP